MARLTKTGASSSAGAINGQSFSGCQVARVESSCRAEGSTQARLLSVCQGVGSCPNRRWFQGQTTLEDYGTSERPLARRLSTSGAGTRRCADSVCRLRFSQCGNAFAGRLPSRSERVRDFWANTSVVARTFRKTTIDLMVAKGSAPFAGSALPGVSRSSSVDPGSLPAAVRSARACSAVGLALRCGRA